jgi:galactose-1-phosphate uridylyltransferase
VRCQPKAAVGIVGEDHAAALAAYYGQYPEEGSAIDFLHRVQLQEISDEVIQGLQCSIAAF